MYYPNAKADFTRDMYAAAVFVIAGRALVLLLLYLKVSPLSHRIGLY